MRVLLSSICLLALAACADDGRDYDASKQCVSRGFQPGTPAYESCVREERTTRLMEQNRREFEQRQQDESYDRARRGIDRPF